MIRNLPPGEYTENELRSMLESWCNTALKSSNARRSMKKQEVSIEKLNLAYDIQYYMGHLKERQ
jgi:hypothetical protein